MFKISKVNNFKIITLKKTKVYIFFVKLQEKKSF